MANQQDHISMALFCDFENVALGVRDANYEKFDIKRVLERLLLKGSIVVKKAYCDWERYKGFKATMHEANFELIEIPHVRQSGKNSADIRLVVDALDLCYTKSHVNTFVIISGDSDFSPLVSKLRENAKHVIGVGVKQSTSDLLIANCDEFIFYDDLVREGERQAARREARNNPREGQPQQRRSPEEERRRREEMDARRAKIIEMAVETYEALVTDRDEGGKIWASVLKEALKRRNPGFSESYYGFRTFGNLLEEAQARGMLEFGRDEKSGAYVFRGQGLVNKPEADSNGAALHEGQDLSSPADEGQPLLEAREPRVERTERQDRGERTDRGERGGRNRGRGGRNRGGQDERRPADHEPIDPVQAVAEHLMADGPEDFEPPADEPWYEPVSADELNIVVPEDTNERGDDEDSDDDHGGGDQERSTNARGGSDRTSAARKTRGRRGRGGSRNTGNLGAEPSAPAAPAPAPTPAPAPVKAARTEPQAKESTSKPAGRANARPARKTSRAAAPAPEAPSAAAEPTGGTSADTKPARKRAPRRTSKPASE